MCNVIMYIGVGFFRKKSLENVCQIIFIIKIAFNISSYHRRPKNVWKFRARAATYCLHI